MEPVFSQIYETHDAEMLGDVYETIKLMGLWDWFREFEPHANEGFMFSPDLELATISGALKYQGHSGASFGWTMRVVHDIAKNGWDHHCRNMIQTRGAACSCRRARGKIVGWCGNAGGGVPACDH